MTLWDGMTGEQKMFAWFWMMVAIAVSVIAISAAAVHITRCLYPNGLQ